MKTASLLLVFLVFVSYLQAQNWDIGITFNPGVSSFGNRGQSDFDGLTNIDSKWRLSGNVGMYINKPLGNKSTIGIALLWNGVESSDVTKEDLFYFTEENGEFIMVDVGTIENTYRYHLSYAVLPIYYQIKSKKLSFRLGFQTMFLSKSNYDFKNNTEYDGDETSTKEHGELPDLKKINYGIKAGFIYHLSEKIGVQFEYYNSFNNVDNEILRFGRPIRQATLGLQYSLTQKKKISEQ